VGSNPNVEIAADRRLGPGNIACLDKQADEALAPKRAETLRQARAERARI